jgi:hypothetical protein
MNSFFSSALSWSQGLSIWLGQGVELGVLGDHAELLLVREDLLAQLLVAAVEQLHRADLVHPLLGRVVRRVGGARRVLDEDRLVGLDLVHARHVVDRVVGHAGDQVPARLALERIDLRGVAEQVGLPLVGVAADEAVEVLEAHAGGPLVEGPDLAGREGRRVVVLAEPRGGIAVVQQHAADGGLVLADDAVVAGKPVDCSEITPKPAEWWLRPVISAARVGEHSAVENMRL